MAPNMMTVMDNENVTKWSLEGGYNESDSIDTDIYPFRGVKFTLIIFCKLLKRLLLHRRKMNLQV